MKKQLLLASILIGAFITAKAQKTDTARMLVHYRFSWVQDTANRAHPYAENMVLYIGKNAAAYRSYDGVVYKVQFKKAFMEAAAATPDGRPNINRRGVGSNTEYYQYPNDQKLVIQDQLMMNTYAINGPMPAIDWKTSGDTATFDGLHCQKATCYFKGRNYIAWFCPDLPVHTGPWKLNGLPGAIVDARDAKNEVVFKFDGVEKATPTPKESAASDDHSGAQVVLLGMDDANGDPNVIELPAKAIRTSEKEFETLRETMRKDPNAFAQSMMAGQGGNLQGNGPKMSFKIKSGPGPVINNPIELPEKK